MASRMSKTRLIIMVILIIAVGAIVAIVLSRNFSSPSEHNELTMIVALDENKETFVNYCQKYNNPRRAIPFTLFIDSEGLVRYVKIGAFASETELWDTLHNLSDSTPQPQEAPNFTLLTMTGANTTLSELEGTPVVLNFWSISCYWCRKQLPYLESVAQQSAGETKVIAVNIVDNAASVRNFFGIAIP